MRKAVARSQVGHRDLVFEGGGKSLMINMFGIAMERKKQEQGYHP